MSEKKQTSEDRGGQVISGSCGNEISAEPSGRGGTGGSGEAARGPSATPGSARAAWAVVAGSHPGRVHPGAEIDDEGG